MWFKKKRTNNCSTIVGQLNMKSTLSPYLMLNLRFPFIQFQIHCMSINSTAETSKLWLVTSVYKLNFMR